MSIGQGALTPTVSRRADQVRAPLSFKLFSLGFLTLALELMLIRYLAGSIYNLGYFPNLVLLAVFIGMGSGFVFHPRVSEGRSLLLAHLAPWLLLLLVVLVFLLHPSAPPPDDAGRVGLTNAIEGPLIPQERSGQGALLFGVWFAGIVAIFACLSQRTAKLFRCFSPLRAYTLDIAGSCAGIITFTVVSFFQLPAFSWFLILAPFLVAALLSEGSRISPLLPIVPLLLIGALSGYQDTRLLSDRHYDGPIEVDWSPYQKIEFLPEKGQLFVNGLAHQAIHTKEGIARGHFAIPYQTRASHPELPPYKNVLIMGAGTGNDVTAALMNGVVHVDAVEIDPVIARIGREQHPGHPYSDPRVTLIVDDARSFLTETQTRYDLIIFALTDSLVKVSSMSQLRLENYLFTLESFKRAYGLLTDTGDLFTYNFYRAPWLAEKLRKSLAETAGKAPEVLVERGDFRMLAVGRARPPGTRDPFYTANVELPRDDWPFLYLRERRIPPIYLGIMGGLSGLIALIALLLRWAPRAPMPESPDRGRLPIRLAFLLMGSAFLLLETKSVVQFSLLFGTTWLNNSLVFLGVLSLVLVANWCAFLLRGTWVVPVAYVLLLASCLTSLIFPLGNLLHVTSLPLRFLAASLLTFSPIFFANLIFSVTFRDQPAPEQVFGWNLIGATVGGVLEYGSMALGYGALAWVVAALYAGVVALLFVGQRLRAGHAVSAS